MMAKFRAQFTYASYQYAWEDIEADTIEEATAIAQDLLARGELSMDWEFDDSEERVEGIERLDP